MPKLPNLDDVLLVKNTVVGGVVSRQAILCCGLTVQLTVAHLDSLYWAIKTSPSHELAAVSHAGPGYAYIVENHSRSMVMSENALYQVNYHEGDGWQVITLEKLQERLGAAFEYAEWLFDQGQTMAQRGVEYRRVTIAPPSVEIIISRDGYFYRYSRIVDGRPDIVNQPIDREHAQGIIEMNPGGNGAPDFGLESCAWEYSAVIDLEEEAT